MTTLFRQGVESVCKGRRERERDRVQVPLCRRKPRLGWRQGRAELRAWGWGGIKRKSRHRAVSGSQSWRPGSHFSFMYSKPLLPPGI